MRRAWKFGRGRFYSRGEQDKAEQVMVLGSVLAERMFGKEDPVGKTVTLWNQPFQIVGVAESGSWMVSAAKGDDQFDAAYVPFTTIHRLLDMDAVSNITLTVAAAGDVTRTTKAVTALLRRRHQIQAPEQRDDFTVSSQARKAIASGGMRREMAQALTGNMNVLDKVTLEQMAKTLERASRTMTALLASVAAVSLLAGGIGIMNTMLLSVTERTREIGIRRAIGARSGDVLRQFLMEAAMLSIFGGSLGVMLGVVTSVAITRWAGWSTSVSGLAVALAFGSAAAVGIFFGYYPAKQASAVAPMESLRYE
jgi:putative ABC transport system permease protein